MNECQRKTGITAVKIKETSICSYVQEKYQVILTLGVFSLFYGLESNDLLFS